jgi:TolB protein
MAHQGRIGLRRTILLLLFALILGLASLSAQTGLDLSAKIQRGDWEPYKIAIGDFKVVGEWSMTADSLAAAVKKVITDDLDFHVFFDTISVNQFYVDVWEIKDITEEAWRRMGADYLVEGKVELAGDDIKVEYKISELTPRLRELTGEKLKTKRFNYRRVAHMIADVAVKQIAAEKGFFTTRIAFISSATGRKELYLCDYDGANVVQLTNDRSINLSPCWDRKEDKLLYTTYKRGGQEVWELEIKSGKSKPISTYPNSNNAAAISPDNEEIAITLSKDGNSDLYVLDRKGDIKRRLTDLSAIEVGASWSPTGREIVFSSDRTGAPQIYVMDADGFGITRLTYEGKYNDSPDFSPRGDALAYVARGDDGNFQICEIDVTGGNFIRLNQTGSNENPHWAPDGWHLVFCKQQGSKYDLYIMDRFKKKVKKITSDGKCSNPAWQPFAN